MWKERLKINIVSLSINHIGGLMLDDNDNQIWYLMDYTDSRRSTIKGRLGF